MIKEKLLYVSPFPPLKSGISDYSEMLAYALKDYFDITLLIDNYELSDENMYRDFTVKIFEKSEIDYDNYKYIIYNIGNNPYYHSYIYQLCLQYPGLVILHDVILFYLIAGYYEKKQKLFSKIYEIGGCEAISIIRRAMIRDKKAILDYKEIAAQLPLNKELIKSGNKIMVHSEYARTCLLNNGMNRKKVRKINLLKQTKDGTVILPRKSLFQHFGIPEEAILITSFGYIAKTKLNHVVCESVKRLSDKLQIPICYVMVGEGNYVDAYIDDKLIFKTGYVTLNQFNSFLEYSDIVVNLRYPSMGETSAAMIRIMEYGKPCIIVSDAWFAEIPKDCVISLEKDEVLHLELELERLIQDDAFRKKLGRRAKEYVDAYHSSDVVCKEIIEFLQA